jgi:hypothetical protein
MTMRAIILSLVFACMTGEWAAIGQTVECSNRQCSFFALDASLFATRDNEGRLEIGEWDGQHRVWRTSGSFVIAPGLDVLKSTVLDDRSAEVLLWNRDDRSRLELWHVDLQPSGTFAGRRVWSRTFGIYETADVHQLPDPIPCADGWRALDRRRKDAATRRRD